MIALLLMTILSANLEHKSGASISVRNAVVCDDGSICGYWNTDFEFRSVVQTDSIVVITPGVYTIDLSTNIAGMWTETWVRLKIVLNGNTNAHVHYLKTSSDPQSVSFRIVLDLSPGDRVDVRIDGSTDDIRVHSMILTVLKYMDRR